MNSSKKINGIHIYRDDKGRTVYYDMLMKNGRIILNSQSSTYFNYSIRGLYCLIITFAICMIDRSRFTLAIIIGLLAYIISSLFFYLSFLKKCPISNATKGKREGYIEDSVNNDSYARVILIIMLTIILGVVFSSGYVTYTKIIYKYLMLVGLIVSCLFLLLYIFILAIKVIRNVKHKQEVK